MTCPRSPRGARTESRVCRKPEKKEEPHSFHEARTHKMCVSQEQPAMHWPSCLQVITPHCLLKTRLLSYSRKLRELLLPNATCPFLPLHTHLPRWLGQGQNWHPDLVLPRPGSFPEKTGCLHQVFQKQKQLSQQLAGSCSGEWGGRRDTSQGGYCQETQGRRLGREETWNSFLSVPSVSPGFQNQWPAWCLC